MREEDIINQCMSLLEENLETEEFFGVYGEVDLEGFKNRLKENVCPLNKLTN